MNERAWARGDRLARLWALGGSAALFCFLWFFTDMHYALGDDFYLARAFAGEVGGVPETYNLYVHTFFAWLLHGLTLLCPGIWWFSWLQLALLFLGSYGVLLGLMRLSRRLSGRLWPGLLTGSAFLWVFTAEFSTSITFTTTSAVLGAGAVCLLGGVRLDGARKPSALGVLGSAVLLWLAYLLRAASALPAAAFWTGLLGYRLLKNGAMEKAKRLPVKPALCGALAAVFLLGASLGIRAGENAALSPEDRAYAEFLNATTVPIDYGGLELATPETLQALGWTEATLAMIRSWYFMDESMSAESFRRVERDALAAPKPPLAQRLAAAKARLLRLFEKTTNVRDFFALCLWLCMAAFYAAIFRKKRCVWSWLAPLGSAGLAGLLLFYLALEGRLPMRAAAAVLLPACAMGLSLVAEEGAALGLALKEAGCFGRGRRKAGPTSALPGKTGKQGAGLPLLRAFPALAALLLCVFAAWNAGTTAFGFYYNPTHGDPDQCAYAGADAYALAHPEQLFIGDRTLGVDRRLFPDRSGGRPENLLPMWGGWNNHSQGYRAVFARYGLAHDGFSVTELLGDTVRLVTGDAGPSAELLNYLAQQAGGEVLAIPEAQGDGFQVYRFARGA